MEVFDVANISQIPIYNTISVDKYCRLCVFHLIKIPQFRRIGWGLCITEWAEVLPREQALVLGLPKHQIEEIDDGVVLDQTFTVHAEDGGTHTASSMARPMNQRSRRLY